MLTIMLVDCADDQRIDRFACQSRDDYDKQTHAAPSRKESKEISMNRKVFAIALAACSRRSILHREQTFPIQWVFSSLQSARVTAQTLAAWTVRTPIAATSQQQQVHATEIGAHIFRRRKMESAAFQPEAALAKAHGTMQTAN